MQKEDLSQDSIIDKNFVEIAKNMQRLRDLDGDYDNDSGAQKPEHRRTIHNLERQRKKTRTIGTLDVAFKQRFFNMTADGGGPGGFSIQLVWLEMVCSETVELLSRDSNGCINQL